MKKRLAALVMSVMVVGALVLPASPAHADHCTVNGGPPPLDEVRDRVACTFEHLTECVAEIIRNEGPCSNWG